MPAPAVQWREADQGGPAEVAEALARLSRHPRFAEAVRACADHSVALYDTNRLLNLLVSDRGRFVMALLALHLHHTAPDGLTPRGLRTACAAYGVCSPGRVSAILALMQWSGHLAPARDGSQRLIPTERFTAMHRDRWRSQLSAAGLVSPEAAEVAMRLDDPETMSRFSSSQAALFFRGFRPLDFAPTIRFSGERLAGVLMLAHLALKHWRAPAGAPVGLSVSDLARRFSVSRPHVNGLLKEAQERELLRRDGESIYVLSPLTEGVTGMFGAAIAANSLAAAETLRGR